MCADLCPGHDTPHKYFVEAGTTPSAGLVSCPCRGRCSDFASRGNNSLDSRPHRGVPFGSTIRGTVTSPEGEHWQQRSDIIGGKRLGRQITIAPRHAQPSQTCWSISRQTTVRRHATVPVDEPRFPSTNYGSVDTPRLSRQTTGTPTNHGKDSAARVVCRALARLFLQTSMSRWRAVAVLWRPFDRDGPRMASRSPKNGHK